MEHPPYDLAIVGAGPAGAMAAWTASRRGLRVLLIDREHFPRDKVCGDAIPYETYKLLQRFDPEAHRELLQATTSQRIRKARMHTPNGKHATIQWVTQAVNARRFDFDNWLFEKALAAERVEVKTGVKFSSMERRAGQWRLQLGGVCYRAHWLLGAGGAHCPVARRLAQKKADRQHHLAAVRTYWKGVSGVDVATNEFFAHRKVSPGYFWIFPLPEGGVNVGLGMLSRDVARKRINLKKLLLEFIEEDGLSERFASATMLGGVRGFDLPLGSAPPQLYGEGWLLCGDAASLIDPLDGHGIGSAMWSGYWAAEAVNQIRGGASADRALHAYAKQLHKRFYKKFRMHRRLIAAFRYPPLLNAISIPALLRIAGFRINA